MATTQIEGRKNVRREVGGFEREKDDFYPTPAALVRPMLDMEKFDGNVWECACGDGAISRFFPSNTVVSTDLVARGFGGSGVDFLAQTKLLAPNIVTNPPFKLWLPFAKHALALGARKVVLFSRLLTLEGKANSAFMRESKLARVLISAGRVNILPPGAIDKGHNGTTAYAWYVWERGHKGDPQIKWFEPSAAGTPCTHDQSLECRVWRTGDIYPYPHCAHFGFDK